MPQVRDWYVESFKELRTFPHIRDANDELKFTELLRHIYRRHANVVPVMAKVRPLNDSGCVCVSC
jgi:pyruvate dehydrogenase kinase 2/3/4